MRRSLRPALFAITAAAAAAGLAAPAAAKCTRLAFSVNDYGKDGPSRDAQKLLDTYIAKWTADRGIKSYKTGPKKVTCELYLDFGVFDEHTCKAEATVCWPDNAPGKKAEGDAGAITTGTIAAPSPIVAPKPTPAAAIPLKAVPVAPQAAPQPAAPVVTPAAVAQPAPVAPPAPDAPVAPPAPAAPEPSALPAVTPPVGMPDVKKAD